MTLSFLQFQPVTISYVDVVEVCLLPLHICTYGTRLIGMDNIRQSIKVDLVPINSQSEG